MLNNNGISNSNKSKFMAPRPEGVKPTTVVITYSVCNNLEQTINALQKNGTSVHYIIDQDGKQYQYHNDLTDKTFFAGKSSWKGTDSVNDFGIGIMLINDAKSEFSTIQIFQLKNLLTDIQERYPEIDLKANLVGLGEITVNREVNNHIAPGKFFPWKDLADSDFGKYFETTDEQKSKKLLTSGDSGAEVKALQENLQAYGYGVQPTGIFDKFTAQAVQVFNTRYNTGLPNEEPPISYTEATQHELELLGV
ncbi:MAG: peptidoglycan recognition protein family protein [Janthinobacterium lividum]